MEEKLIMKNMASDISIDFYIKSKILYNKNNKSFIGANFSSNEQNN